MDSFAAFNFLTRSPCSLINSCNFSLPADISINALIHVVTLTNLYWICTYATLCYNSITLYCQNAPPSTILRNLLSLNSERPRSRLIFVKKSQWNSFFLILLNLLTNYCIYFCYLQYIFQANIWFNYFSIECMS